MVQQHYDQWQIRIHLRKQIIKFKNSTRKNNLSYNKTVTFTLHLTSLEWKNYLLNLGKQFIQKWSQDEKNEEKNPDCQKYNTLLYFTFKNKIWGHNKREIRTSQNTQVHWPHTNLLTKKIKLGKVGYEPELKTQHWVSGGDEWTKHNFHTEKYDKYDSLGIKKTILNEESSTRNGVHDVCS